MAVAAAAAAATVVPVALVAASRACLGAHQASDVAALVLPGVAWLGLCLTAAQRPARAARSMTMR